MKFLTFLNAGCVDICKNMLESANRVGISKEDFYIACLDLQSFEEFKGYTNCFLYKNQNITEYQNWSFDNDSSFRQIVKYKWEIIESIYANHKELCWVDTDIVFVRNPSSFIENNSKMLFQTDLPGSKICSGFMVFNDTVACSELISKCASCFNADDQLVVNGFIDMYYQKDYELLPTNLFPNGYEYYTLGNKKDAIIVHNNWMVGVDTKIEKFKSENLWYL